MIVVSGNLGSNAGRGTSATGIAERVAALGSPVEIVGILGLDAGGDQALLALRGAGVGHAAVARSPAGNLEPADLDLALRYLPDIGSIVLVEPNGDLASTAAAAAGWSGAGLIVVVAADGTPQADEGGPDLGDRAIVLAAPARDPDGSFAGFVATLAIRLAAGATAADAWRDTATALGVEALSAASPS